MLSFFTSLLDSLPNAVGQGLAWGIMAIGVYITYRLLDIADLTVDGSLATGGAVAAVAITIFKLDPWIATLLALLAGMLAGLITGILHTVCKIPAILSGILTQLALYSINLRILAIGIEAPTNANVSLQSRFNSDIKVLFSGRHIREFSLRNPIVLLTAFVIAVIAILYWYFGTESGSALRATGANGNMARAQGINTKRTKVLGLMLSNGMVALSGALLAQFSGSATVDMGKGAIVIGLAAIIIGEVLLGKLFRNFALKLLTCVIGAILYYVVITAVLGLSFVEASDLNLLAALAVAVFLTIPNLRSGKPKKAKKPKAETVPKPQEALAEEKNVKPQKQNSDQLPIKFPVSKKWDTDAPANALWDNIHKTFNAGTINEKKALQGLTLHLEPGEFVTVIGGNGAGKSTLMNSVAGVYGVDIGRIVIAGKDMTRLPEHKRAKYIGRVFQDPMMGTAATMQIEENLALAARRGKKRGLKRGISKAERAFYKEQLKILDLGLEDRLTAKVGLLSGGQRQALTLLMATLQKPKLLLLDEHTAALDPKTAAKVLDATQRIIEKDNLTTLMITHNMRDAIAYGNRLIMMYDGRIVVDVSGEEKKNLTVEQLLNLFSQVSGSNEANDKLLLS